MNPLAINTVGDELELSAAYCRAENLGLEFTAFAFPRHLDHDYDSQIERHCRAVGGIKPLLAHGPFFELVVTSHDPAIVEVARRRHSAALAAAIRIGASYYIAHANYLPLIRHTTYRNRWAESTLDFWLPFADEAGRHNMTICFENVWEPGPELQAELITKGNHPYLRASFDNGHALVDSKIPSDKWIASLGPFLAHCHLHDNSGEMDEHKPVGEGKENWGRLISSIKKYAPGAVLVTESDKLALNKSSIDKLRSLF